MRVPYIHRDIPRDILHIILEYDGRIKYKNGKYIINTDIPLYDNIKYSLGHRKIAIINNMTLFNGLKIYKNIYLNIVCESDNYITISFDNGNYIIINKITKIIIPNWKYRSIHTNDLICWDNSLRRIYGK